MKFFNEFRISQSQQTATTAKERLKIIIAHEHHHGLDTDYLPKLQIELLEVVRKYVVIEDEHLKIHIDREGDYEILELNIILPDMRKQ